MKEHKMFAENTKQKEVKPKSYKKIRLIAVIAATVLTSAAAVCGGLWAYFNPDINPSVLGEPKIILSSDEENGDELLFFTSPDLCWVDWGNGSIQRCDKEKITYQDEVYRGFRGEKKGGKIKIYSSEDMTFFQCINEKINFADTSGCPALRKLHLSNNVLADIDLSANTRLETLTLETLILGNMTMQSSKKML